MPRRWPTGCLPAPSDRLRAALARALLGLTLVGPSPPLHAQKPAELSAARLFAGADLALGSQLIADKGCARCHVARYGGDGSAVYRPRGRINTPSLLRAQVERCSQELKLSLFPEEVDAIAAVLNRDHYRFP
jgi:hypothetical protein